MILILINCFFYIYYKKGDFSNKMESIFMIIYMIEMLLKIIGFGLFEHENSYFKIVWNIIDFGIIISYYLKSYIFINIKEFPNFGVFRVIRIIKILPVREFQVMIKALWDCSSFVFESLIVFLAFVLCFSIIGFQLFKDSLKNQCIEEITGISFLDFGGENHFCGNSICKINYFCGKVIKNPDFGLTNFDTFFYSFIQVLRIITFDKWTLLMNQIQRTYTNYAFLYFVVVAIIGNYFLNNFILAVIKVKFTQSWNLLKERELNKEDVLQNFGKRYDFKMIRKLGGKVSKFQRKLFHNSENLSLSNIFSQANSINVGSQIRSINLSNSFHKRTKSKCETLIFQKSSKYPKEIKKMKSVTMSSQYKLFNIFYFYVLKDLRNIYDHIFKTHFNRWIEIFRNYFFIRITSQSQDSNSLLIKPLNLVIRNDINYLSSSFSDVFENKYKF